MRHKKGSILLLCTAFLLLSCSSREHYDVISGFAQGGTYTIRCKIPAGTTVNKLQSLVDGKLEEIDNSISGYNKSSILSRINNGEEATTALDTIFINVFNRSKEIWELSEGIFDPSAGSLFSLWGYGFESKDVDTTKIDGLLEHIGMDLFSLEEDAAGNVFLHKKDSLAQLNFNAIAQGYSCDVVGALLESFGCDDYIIEIGGEIVCKGESSRGGNWRIWIDKPLDGNDEAGAIKQDILSITDCGVVTSGNYRKFYYENGEKFSHTINPKTGYPVKHTLLSATVIAQDGTTADAYATWFMVVGLEKARELAKEHGVGAYLVYGEQDNMLVWHTEGLQLDEETK